MMDTIDKPVKDLWRIFRVMAEFVEGFDELTSIGPAVSFFGSSRAKPQDKYYQLAERTASVITKAGFAVMTGGGPAGTTTTLSPRVFWVAPNWWKKQPLRQRWRMEVDVNTWMEHESKDYDSLMTDIATIHDATTPVSMSIGNLSTTYSVNIQRVTADWREAETPGRVGPITLLVQEIS